MNRNGEIGIFDPSGRERERYPVAYGAHIRVEDGQARHAPRQRALRMGPVREPDPHRAWAARIKFGDIVEGSTMQEQVDEFTGLSSRVIVESRDPEMRPSISVKNEADETVYQALLPVGAYLSVSEGEDGRRRRRGRQDPAPDDQDEGHHGRSAARGRALRGAEAQGARRSSPRSTASSSFGPDSRGKRRVLVTPDRTGEPREYLIPKGKHVSVHEGDQVRPGEPLMDGSSNPHDILRIEGEQELAKWMVDEVQEVYRLQGVKINDKHIEIIIRQMLRKVRVTTVGDTDFLVGEHVDKVRFDEANARMEAEGREPAAYEPLLLGITKASLSTESFISAASFQETTKVLTEAAIWGKTDHLHGLKENVIMGRLIPAGTGLPATRTSGSRSRASTAAAESSRRPGRDLERRRLARRRRDAAATDFGS